MRTASFFQSLPLRQPFVAVLLWVAIGTLEPQSAAAQAPLNITVDLASLEGVELTPANAFSYRILNGTGAVQEVRAIGILHFRNSPLRLSYTFDTRLEPGVNVLSAERVGHPVWTASDEALRSLFLTYNRLPQGTYEYCVTVAPKPRGSEQAAPEPVDGCTYHTVEDLFAINLIDPEDKAQLYEHYPTFSWAVNYPFASELTYRIRVAEQKAGQNPANAIARNNPVYQETGVLATTATYPLAARPLEVGQPYVWAVDAYYHGLLLGGAETWRFMIVEDSLLMGVPKDPAYYDFAPHYGESRIYVIGTVKLKYENSRDSNQLSMQIVDTKAAHQTAVLPYGDNRIDWDVRSQGLRHSKQYLLRIRDVRGTMYNVPFIYLNPDYVQ